VARRFLHAIASENRGIKIMKAMGKSSLASALMALINIGCYGTLVLLALSMCLLVIAPWVNPPRIEVGIAVPTAFKITPETHPMTASPPGMENVHLEQVRGSLRFSPRSRNLVGGFALLLIVVLSLTLWVLVQLRGVFRALRAGQPFVPANAIRIRRVAYAVIAGEIARAILVYIGMRYAATHFSIQGLQFEARPDINVIAIICGLIILVIAEIFREGTRLDEEQSLTI
jgi:hypothetical protein